ncbi:hypothetical protein BDZ91DRAFT_708351 [Kalaharituber pfeilii]|nr:hypothetical protein BDZ91DRAFT_708351 [Kalaharituber pfeilii]
MAMLKVLLLGLMVGMNLGILVTLVLLFRKMNSFHEVLLPSEFFYTDDLGTKIPENHATG